MTGPACVPVLGDCGSAPVALVLGLVVLCCVSNNVVRAIQRKSRFIQTFQTSSLLLLE